MLDLNTVTYLTYYTALRHRKQQTFDTEVSGPRFTPDSMVSLAINT
jgi:hypothetical protein